MKRVMIVTYYWPPAGGIGVQRWLQFSKYLLSYGWQPIIFTAKNPKYPVLDQTLLQQVPESIEIHRVKVPEPNNITSLFQKKGNESKAIYKLQQQSDLDHSVLKKIMWSIRGNFFIPDARMFWINKSFRYIDRYLKENSIDAIISTGPPHSAHLIAEKISIKHSIPWISDFRDPWTSMDYLQKMNLKSFAKKKHEQLEKSVLLNSSFVSVVGKTMQNEFKQKYNIESVIITNGYDDIDESSNATQLDTKFTIVHTGSFLHYRNCNDLWLVLSELTTQNKEFAKNLEIKLVGNVAPVVLEAIEKFGLTQYLNVICQVNHAAAKTIQQSAQLLLLPIDRIKNAEFVITGKLFEYLKSKRPIFMIGPSKGDAAHIIKSCSAGVVVDFDDYDSIKQHLIESYKKYTHNNNQCNSINIEQYSYKELTKTIVKLLDKATIK